MYRNFNSLNTSNSNLNAQYERQLNFQRNRPNQIGNSNNNYNGHSNNNNRDVHSNNSNRDVHSNNSNRIKLMWEETDFPSFSHPEVWGSSFWMVLHISSMTYPASPSPIYKNRMKNFITGIPVMLPCEVCKHHADIYINKIWNKLDYIVSSRDELFKFFVDFHNEVNKRNGKKVLSYQEAYKIYSSPIKIKKLKYD